MYGPNRCRTTVSPRLGSTRPSFCMPASSQGTVRSLGTYPMTRRRLAPRNVLNSATVVFSCFVKRPECGRCSAGTAPETQVGCTSIQEAALASSLQATHWPARRPCGHLWRLASAAFYCVAQLAACAALSSRPRSPFFCTSPDPGDRSLGAVVFEHLVD